VANIAKATAPSSLLLTREIVTIASMTFSREMDCHVAIIRGRIETWEEGVDRNLCWFNELVSNRCFQWARGW